MTEEHVLIALVCIKLNKVRHAGDVSRTATQCRAERDIEKDSRAEGDSLREACVMRALLFRLGTRRAESIFN